MPKFQFSAAKFHLIILLLFLVGVTIFSACNKSTANSENDLTASDKKGPSDDIPIVKNDNADNADAANKSNETNDDDSRFPTVPAEIMQAKNNTSDSKSLKLADFKGKILIVNLWATWCGPCRMETPELVKLHNEYKKKGVEVIGLSVEEQEESNLAVKRFTEQMKVPYRIGWANEVVQIGLMQNNSSIPQTFLINREGKLTAVFRGFNPVNTPPKLRSALNKILEDK